jgi:hypothetical protein
VVLQRLVRHRNLGERPGLDEVGDLFDDTAFAGLPDTVRELGDDDRALSAAQLLDVRAAPYCDASPAGAVRVTDAAAPYDRAAGRKVRALDVLGQALDVDRGVVDHRVDRGGDLAEVMRRDVRRHTDGDPRGTVDKKVREPRRQHGRLAPRLVVVGNEVDGVGIDVAQHLRRDA